MQQAGEPVFLGGVAQQFHEDDVVIGGDIGIFEDGGNFELCRRHFVMPGLDRNPQFHRLVFDFLHEGEHAFADGTEILVFKLLVFFRAQAEQGAAGHHQIGAQGIVAAVDEKIFLLRPDGGDDTLDGEPEQLQDAAGMPGQHLLAFEQRRFLVERRPGIGKKAGGNDQSRTVGPFHDEGGRRRIPCRIAARFKGGANAAAGKARGVGFAFDQLFAGKLLNGCAPPGRHNERIVFFRRTAGHREEQMGEVGRPLFQRPVLHRRGDDIGDGGINARPGIQGLAKRGKFRLGQAQLHHLLGKNIFTKNFNCRLLYGKLIAERLGDGDFQQRLLTRIHLHDGSPCSPLAGACSCRRPYPGPFRHGPLSSEYHATIPAAAIAGIMPIDEYNLTNRSVIILINHT